MDRNDPKGIDERSLRFFTDILTFVDTIQKGPKTVRIIEQLVDAAGSIGGNREEALGGSSRKEFIRYNEIALRGANETVRWLRACAAKQLGAQAQCVALLDEARQLARILGRIIVTSKNRDNPGSEDDGTPES
jgi:four helix bundle protein